jgi:hypothetical protein
LRRGAPLFIYEQIARMKAAWPTFAVHNVDRLRQSARWTGSCTPQFTRYKLELRYRINDFLDVRVLSPALVRLPGNAEGQLPHVYPPVGDPTLCLFDPSTDQWDWSMPLSDTIIPWSFDWIACYELWLMTGAWTGGGRHVGARTELTEPENHK